MASYQKLNITMKFLDENPNAYFVFGDNLIHKGHGGAAYLRDHPHALGFITKKYPDQLDNSYYQPAEYSAVFFEELLKLKTIIEKRPDNIFYISQLGGGLANKYQIWEVLIRDNLVEALGSFENVVFCWAK